jgi:hypothetical protein
MTCDQLIQRAEADLFATLGAEVDEFFLPLGRTGERVRVLTHGSGPPPRTRVRPDPLSAW